MGRRRGARRRDRGRPRPGDRATWSRTRPGHRGPRAPRVVDVTIAHGRHDHLARQRASLDASSRRPDEHVVAASSDTDLLSWPAFVVSLAATPSVLPLVAARNLGVQTALDLAADV